MNYCNNSQSDQSILAASLLIKTLVRNNGGFQNFAEWQELSDMEKVQCRMALVKDSLWDIVMHLSIYCPPPPGFTIQGYVQDKVKSPSVGPKFEVKLGSNSPVCPGERRVWQHIDRCITGTKRLWQKAKTLMQERNLLREVSRSCCHHTWGGPVPTLYLLGKPENPGAVCT